ncbi:cation:proton antiporter [Candidatus Woesearchaeota archaeon]|nr:cation:proton antiporter [Candidatus Woesearchaeota archaeon]
MEFSALIDIGIVIAFAALLANVAKLLKQPLILGYVIAGILIGESFFGIIENTEFIKTLSELGIAFLLFFVGMELDFSKLKKMSRIIIITGLIQVIITFFLGALLASFWFSFIEATYIGLIVAFSSTMIVIKLLSEENVLDTLHGRIILGILLIQDIMVVIILPLLTTLGKFSYILILTAILKTALLFGIAFLSKRFIFPSLIKSTAKSHELLFITSIGICFIFAALSYILGFSIAIGAFLAGIALATFPYNLEIGGRIKSLKDFFSVIFFVTLGTQITFSNISKTWLPLISLLLFILIIKPLIIFTTLKFFKHGNRTSFLSSVSLSQISEFSLILAILGLSLSHISQEIFNITLTIMIVTTTITSYIIKYHEKLFNLVSKHLIPLEKFTNKKNLENLPKEIKNHIIIFGAHRIGSKIILKLKKARRNFIVVDYNPEVIKKLISDKINCIYGDIGNIDLLEDLKIENAKLIISTIPNTSDNLLLIELAKKKNKKITICVTTKTAEEAVSLYKNGADFVALPELLTGLKITEFLHGKSKKEIQKAGKEFYEQLISDKKKDKLMW